MSGIMMALLGANPGGAFISSQSISDNDAAIFPATASASSSYELGADGVARFFREKGTDGTYSGEWRLLGASSDYEVRFTTLSGTFTAGTFDTWLSLGTSRSITVSASQSTVGTTSNSATARVEIRTTGGILLTSADITCSATADVD